MIPIGRLAPNLTADDYATNLHQLMPRGLAWTRRVQSTLGALIAGYAIGLARADADIRRLNDEADPRSTTEMLPEWETAAGLPDPCVTAPQTLGERRKALYSRVTSTGGANAAYFEQVARDLGYTPRVVEVDTHVWRLDVAEETKVTLFRSGSSRAGDRLRTFGNEQLECVINRLKPAHTRVLFAYGVDLEAA